ncbi:MAG: DedA family protein [Gordonia sp. (in: high G+C Gram-positive bacteria)]|uniref:DedA family protein n=1 Tax=Gordonia sp. (in: high G+C Gram-positive bacteria) TaxID=84139 RepID=UPI0039E2ECC4
MESLGAFGAGLAIAIENIFPPLPSEVILPLAGFAAGRGDLTLLGAIFWTTAGSIVGALVLYLLGARLGRDRMRRLVVKVPLVDIADVDRTEAWFDRHGDKAVLLGRMIPLFRSFISVPAGIERMPVARFLVLTLIGSAVWNTVFILAGYLLGENWETVQRYADVLQWIVVAVVVAAVVVFVVRRVRNRPHEVE